MRKITFILFAIFSSFLFVACNKDKEMPEPTPENKQGVITTSISDKNWHYFSLTENKIVGSDEESLKNNAQWGARNDWDFAVRSYHIRTNSGKFTTAGAKGGVHIYKTAKGKGGVYYVFDNNIPFASVKKVPSDAIFETDKTQTYMEMSGMKSAVQSEAKTFTFEVEEKEVKGEKKWVMKMPPIFLPAPLCIFRTADGNSYYKVQFANVLDDKGKYGVVKFNFAKINKD